MIQLDRTEQRIVGVLIEKQRTVPDTYPMSQNALLSGCNQSSNRDPVMSLEDFEIAGALMALHGRDLVVRVDGGGRVAKYRHKLDEKLGVGDHQLAVLAELLLRGPQAPGALKPRVARMGFHGTPAQVEDVLRELAAGNPALCAQEPKRPRERDHRWRHLLGDVATPQPEALAPSAPPAAEPVLVDRFPLDQPSDGPASNEPAAPAPDLDAVLQRLSALEDRVAHLERELGE